MSPLPGGRATLCDPIWHVSSRSSVATLRTAILLLLTYLHKTEAALSLLLTLVVFWDKNTITLTTLFGKTIAPKFCFNNTAYAVNLNTKLCCRRRTARRVLGRNLVNCRYKLYDKSTTSRSNGVGGLQLTDV